MFNLHFQRMASLTAAVAVILASVPAAQARDTMKDFDFAELQAQPQAVTHDYIDAKTPKTGTFSKKETIDEVRRLGIVGFQVVFSETTTEETQGSTWKGITQGQFNDNRWELSVVNMTAELRQQITDKLYADLSTQLTEAGFEVVPHEEFAQNEHYQEFVAETTAKKGVLMKTQLPISFGKNVIWTVSPKGFPIEGPDLTADIFEGAKPSFMGSFKLTASQFSRNGITSDLSSAYQDFSDFTPVSATYFVDIKKQKAVGSFLPGNPFHSSDKDSLFGLSASPGSNIRFYTRVGEGGGFKQKYASGYQLNFLLTDPIQSTQPVGVVDFNGENVGAQAASIAASMALRTLGMPGIKAAKRVRKYELTIDADTFSQQATQILGAVNQMMVLAISQEGNPGAARAEAKTDSTVDAEATSGLDAEVEASVEIDTTNE